MGIEMPVPAKPEGVDAEVWEQMLHATPAEARHLIREGKFAAPTSGLCPGYAQANLIILPREQAYDFLLFAQRNPKPCPILEVTEVGERMTHICAKDCDVATDFPGYRIYKDGVMVDEVDDVVDYWRDDLVAFIIGCSFSFESELIEAGIEMRHNTQGRNVSMYLTNLACDPPKARPRENNPNRRRARLQHAATAHAHVYGNGSVEHAKHRSQLRPGGKLRAIHARA